MVIYSVTVFILFLSAVTVSAVPQQDFSQHQLTEHATEGLYGGVNGYENELSKRDVRIGGNNMVEGDQQIGMNKIDKAASKESGSGSLNQNIRNEESKSAPAQTSPSATPFINSLS
ncbi:uncharacterized protein VTP21DRAFT_10796 [Calcarisporiella thermophila]|uniref:uncharacterized protein n=1 Tax=Calcarisporiella thermophila TaxID=911321 RepID=UPI0037421521